MKNKSDERLDELLQQWAENRAATDEQVTTLRDRVSSALDQAMLVDVPVTPRPSRDLTVTKRLAWFCLGAAAAVVVALLLWPDRVPAPQPVSSDTSPGPPEREDGIPAFAALTEEQLNAKAVLWKEMENIFPDQLQWAAESDEKVAMGLLREAKPASGKGTPIAIRVVVVSRTDDDRAWTPVWTVDVVTRQEEVVALTPECFGVGKLLLWTYPMPDGMVAVDGRIALPDPTPVDSSFSGIQARGTTKAIMSVNSGDVQYRVYQTIALVGEKMG
jgi:hypothetical protein